MSLHPSPYHFTCGDAISGLLVGEAERSLKSFLTFLVWRDRASLSIWLATMVVGFLMELTNIDEPGVSGLIPRPSFVQS